MKLKRLLASLMLAVMAISMVTGCGGAEGRKAKYLERGKTYLAEENYDKAKVELKNVLQIDPKNSEAYYLIGQVEERKSNWQAAFANYSKAAELDPDHIPAQASVGRFYLYAKETEKADEIAQTILSKKPEDPAGRILKAAILFSKKDVSGAVKLVQDVIFKDTAQVEAIILLAEIYRQEGRSSKAQEALEKGIVDNPKFIGLRLQLSRLYMRMKKPDKAEEQLQAITSIEPKNLQHLANLAIFYRQTKQLDKAEKIFRELIKTEPEDVQRHLLLAEFLANERNKEEAEKQLLADIQEYPKMHELRFSLAMLYELAGKSDMAVEQYRNIIDAKGTETLGLTAQVRLANLLLQRPGKTPEEPERLIDEVLEKTPRDNAALLMKGKILMAKGKAADAITAFRSILKDQPDSLEILILLGNAHLVNNERELAGENIKKAVELNPKNPKAHMALAEFFAKQKDFNGALKSLDTAIKLAPKELDLYLAKVEVQAAKNDLKGVEKTLAAVQAALPNNPVVHYRMGQLYVNQKKYDQALREFENSLKLSPGATEALIGITNVHIARGKPDKAIGRLNEILKISPNHVIAHKLLADVYQSQKQFDNAEKELRRVIELNPKWNIPYISMAGIYFVRKDVPGAIKIFEQGLQSIPDDPQLMLSLASTYEINKSYQKAIDVYERVLIKNPDNMVAINNLANLLVEYKNEKESLQRAKTLALRLERTKEPAFRDTLGWVHYKSGEIDKAIPLLEAVVKEAPKVPVFRYHLGMAYYKKGNNAAAKTHLAEAVGSSTAFPGMEEARETLKKIP